MNRTLAGKTIFISGGSRGIGLAIGLRAARDGANIAIAAKTSKPHPSLPGTIGTAAQQIEEAGGRALPLFERRNKSRPQLLRLSPASAASTSASTTLAPYV